MLDGTVPWPVSLGVAGGSIVLLISFLTWFIRQLVTQNMMMKPQHDSEIAALKATHEREMENATATILDWKGTASAERDRANAAQGALIEAVSQNRIVSKFFDEVPVRRPGVHDGPQEVGT